MTLYYIDIYSLKIIFLTKIIYNMSIIISISIIFEHFDIIFSYKYFYFSQTILFKFVTDVKSV